MRECGCVPGHKMTVLTSACADCGLTEEQVFDGHVGRCGVPIRPGEVRCPKCRGSGNRVPYHPMFGCPRCDGTGVIINKRKAKKWKK